MYSRSEYLADAKRRAHRGKPGLLKHVQDDGARKQHEGLDEREVANEAHD